jgi:hypothetical protein
MVGWPRTLLVVSNPETLRSISCVVAQVVEYLPNKLLWHMPIIPAMQEAEVVGWGIRLALAKVGGPL